MRKNGEVTKIWLKKTVKKGRKGRKEKNKNKDTSKK